jgi:uncharacterized membrane-anchored protein YjiN (DUF445 family)
MTDASPASAHPRAADLARMKLIALGLLMTAGVLYLVAVLLGARHPAWAYVAAFSEAAMVGAIADWFAVVALFRHPLGLPIPHTAIIPSNKNRIGANLATFICANFLGTEAVLDKIKRFGAATRLANWLADAQHAEQAAIHLGAALRYALGAFDDRRVRRFIRTTLIDQLDKADIARLASSLLAALTTDGRHQALLDALLRKLATVLDDETLKAKIAEVIAAEVKYLRLVGLDNVAGRYATSKIVAGVIRLVGEMADHPEHPLRLEFDGFVASFIERLKDDPALRTRWQVLQRELLASPALSRALHGLWHDLVHWIRSDLTAADSVLLQRTITGIRRVGHKLQTDPQMQAWLEEQLLAAAPRWIERYREDIRLYIIARVSDWNTGEMTRELERNIGRDLQFIRINGTLVGGLVGLVIFSATQWLRTG